MKKLIGGMVTGIALVLLCGAAQFYFSGPIASTALSGYSSSLANSGSSTVLLSGIAFTNVTGAAGLVVATPYTVAASCNISVTAVQTNGVLWLTNITKGLCNQLGGIGASANGTNIITISMQVAAGDVVEITNTAGTTGIQNSTTNTLF